LKPGVRITGGEHRGRGLTVPAGARPTEGRVREALFSIWGERLSGARVLDLFAGSGVVGLEALGRGALSVLAVDEGARAMAALEENAERLKASGFTVRRLSLPKGLTRLAEQGPFDLVFADPPYDFDAYEELLVGTAPLLAPDGEVAVEHAGRRALPVVAGPLVRVDERRYGESALAFYRVAGE
jgi:16S rRNA (guanine966-N2)-methyltransferase